MPSESTTAPPVSIRYATLCRWQDYRCKHPWNRQSVRVVNMLYVSQSGNSLLRQTMDRAYINPKVTNSK
jgi:hypothetical protein